MPETFLILLCGGTLFAAAISDPRAVILRWLRLAGIIALSLAALAMFFIVRHDSVPMGAAIGAGCTIAATLAQLAFVQVAWRDTQRTFGALAVACAVITGALALPQARPINPILLVATCSLGGVTMGLALMDMLLGHAYLNAAQMTLAPFVRLNLALAATMTVRAGLSIIGTVAIQSIRPMEMFWNVHGLYIGTRWLVGFLVPGIFVWMAQDCIKRRATQSATGILYVAGVLIFIGEMIGLYLMSETGVPL